ncbi:MAG: fumarylacetoacetate hydrolase family protein, partial [Gemmatimonadales bacterium]
MTRYVRYAHRGRVSYGVLEGETVRGLTGDIFAGSGEITGELALSEVRLLVPCALSKVIAVGLNYRSHLKGRPEPEYPGLFAVLPSAVVGPEDEIVIPPDAGDVHYEGELVVVIGKQAKNVSAADASDFVFGVTAGNDVSERNWQRSDLQWVRAKASDSFAPVGPAIA